MAGIFEKLSKLFEKKEEKKEEQAIILQLNDVSDFLSNNLEKIKEIKEASVGNKEKLLTKITELRIAVNSLKDAETTKKFPDKVIATGDAIRTKICEDAIKIIDHLPNGMQDLLAESRRLSTLLNLDAKKTELLTVLYEKEIEKMAQSLVELNKEINSFEKFIRKDLAIIKTKDEFDSFVEDIHDRKKRADESFSKIEKMSDELAFFESKKRAIKSKLHEMDAFRKSEDVKKLDAEKERIELENKNLASELDIKFSEIGKALKKLKYARDRSKTFPDQRIIDDYLRSSSKALITDANLAIIDVITELKNSVRELDFDEKQEFKIISAIEKLTKEYLASKQKEYKVNLSLLEEVDMQKTQLLAPIAFNEKTMERELEGLKSDIMRVDAEREVEQKIKQKYDEELKKSLEELKQKIFEMTNKRVEVIH